MHIGTKIVCTIGPACEDEITLEKMFLAGMNVARFNFKHGEYEWYEKVIERIRNVSAKHKTPIALLQDLQGPDVRIGKFKDGSVELKAEQNFFFTTEMIEGTVQGAFISLCNLTQFLHEGDKVLIDDGKIELSVKRVTDIKCDMEVINGGTLGSRKGVNIPGKRPAISCLTDKDEKDVEFGLKNKVDFIAQSFVQSADDVHQLRAMMKRIKGEKSKYVQVISKIESQGGIDNFDEILEASDSIMIARGDMGIELPAEEVPLIQKEMIRKCNIAGKPVITATQMLDSMERNPHPTRAEVSDIANAVLDSTDAIMLSGETASGDYPVEAVKTMMRVSSYIEDAIRDDKIDRPVYHGEVVTVADSVSYQSGQMAQELEAKVILCITTSGSTPRNVARFRPDVPIIAASPYGMLQRQLLLIHGVSPFCLRVKETEDVRALIWDALDQLRTRQKVQPGDRIIVTVGMKGAGDAGGTNLIYVHTVGAGRPNDIQIDPHEKADLYCGVG